jgi:hypothetical protein
MPRRLSDIGNAFESRFKLNRRPYRHEECDIVPLKLPHPVTIDMPILLRHLGLLLSSCSERTRDVVDIGNAISIFQRHGAHFIQGWQHTKPSR